MTGIEIIKHIEDWAPKSIAWERDNVGLQIGSLNRKVSNIMLCLDVTQKVVDEAIRKKCNFIFSHHPLLFHSLKSINTDDDEVSLMIEKLIKQNITLYSAHTNLDFTNGGVSFELAKTLNLQNIKFLENLKSTQFKLVVFIPKTDVDKVSNAIFNSGGGAIGNYSNCSFRSDGTGTFKGSKESNPSIGEREKLAIVDEVKFEVLVDKSKLNKVVDSMLNVHPYEEVAYDIIPLANDNMAYGVGAIGDLEVETNEKQFLNFVSKKLKAKNLRYTKGSNKKIKTVAVCGGSGSDLFKKAIQKNADAFITADVKYHTFQDAQNKILLIDAGHFETEIHSLNKVRKHLLQIMNAETKHNIYKYSGSTNPIIFYNN